MSIEINTAVSKTATAVATDINVQEYYGDKEVRWFQIAARNALYEHLENGVQRVLIWLPTGSGKTITIACTLDDPRMRSVLGITDDRKLRVLFFAHVNRLLTQAEETFTDANHVEIRMCSAFTPVTDADIEWADVVVIDEAHHEAMMSIQNQLDNIGQLPIIGLTATPDRPDGMVIKFEEIVAPISREQAVSEGWLAETSVFSVVDMSGKNKSDIVCDVLSTYAHTMGQTMIFMKTRAEVTTVTNFLIEQGFKAIALIGQTNNQLNEELIAFGEGETQFLVNCAKIGEGVDVSGCTTVLLGRQLRSYTMLNQYIGRASRPDSNCNVWELINPLAGNNLDTTVVVGTPKSHTLIYDKDNEFVEQTFNYVANVSALQSGVSAQYAED